MPPRKFGLVDRLGKMLEVCLVPKYNGCVLVLIEGSWDGMMPGTAVSIELILLFIEGGSSGFPINNEDTLCATNGVASSMVGVGNCVVKGVCPCIGTGV